MCTIRGDCVFGVFVGGTGRGAEASDRKHIYIYIYMPTQRPKESACEHVMAPLKPNQIELIFTLNARCCVFMSNLYMSFVNDAVVLQ